MRGGTPSVLAVITARGGSKGLPRKNIRLLCGRPLISWSIEAALGASCIDRVIVSTDSPEIAEVACAAGAEVPFLRPPELASDTASSTEVLAHALQECPGYGIVVLLQPTSPLRTSEDLDRAFNQMRNVNADGCVAVTAVEKSPWLMYGANSSGWLEPLLPSVPNSVRRQDMPPVYLLNGAFYFIWTDIFLAARRLVTARCIGYTLPEARSIDIDTLADFRRAEHILSTRAGKTEP